MQISSLVSKSDLLALLPEFIEVYNGRPIKINHGGMGFNHCFATFAIAKTIEPSFIIESGVWRGQSTWLFEHACPRAQIVAIDPAPEMRLYTSPKANYQLNDFALLDWSQSEKESALCFFDDHQNAFQRLQDLKWWGFKRAIFEDNFPCGEGDCYSLRHVWCGYGHPRTQMSSAFLGTWKERWRRKWAERLLYHYYPRQSMVRRANDIDQLSLKANLSVYQEIPPVLRYNQNNWGGGWAGEYSSEPPLFESVEESPFKQSLLAAERDEPDHAFRYSYICYAELS